MYDRPVATHDYDDGDLELTPVPSAPALVRRAAPIALAAMIGAAGYACDPGEPLYNDAGPGVHDAGISVPVDAGPGVADAGVAPPADAGE